MALIPILTYHSMHGPGDEYRSNDHIALETDLDVAHRLGFRIAPLADVVAYVTGEGAGYLAAGSWVALTFDDGPDWDYFDYDYDGRRFKGFYTILLEHLKQRPERLPIAVSFVIASRVARTTLDKTCGAGRDRWTDEWWKAAAESGVLAIGNHSWDHVHPALPNVEQREQRKGTFLGVDTFADAEIQVRRAEAYICEHTGGRSAGLFAHPYGDAPAYLVNEYFPRFHNLLRIRAAFITGGQYAARGVNRWKIPRFVCGEHWSAPDELARILVSARTAREIQP